MKLNQHAIGVVSFWRHGAVSVCMQQRWVVHARFYVNSNLRLGVNDELNTRHNCI